MTRQRKKLQEDAQTETPAEPVDTGGNYFTEPKTNIDFITSGSTMLDLVLGGGWPLGRISNVVGDKSTGKTLLAIEACANFGLRFEGPILYREAEAAFDTSYAKALGMPIDQVSFIPEDVPFETIEDWYTDLTDVLQKQETDTPGLYILDSLDALSDRAEQERKIDEDTMGMTKQKKLGELFRKLVRLQEKKNMHLMIISQVRDNIGVAFGDKHRRSGGRSLDFYASQALWLSHIKTLKRTVKGIDRPYGIRITAKCKKNKVGLPLRECSFNIIFGYGIDDLESILSFLYEAKASERIGLNQAEHKKLLGQTMKMDVDEYEEWVDYAKPVAQALWYEIERSFIPKRSKYA